MGGHDNWASELATPFVNTAAFWIDLHKTCIPFVYAALMYRYQCFTATMWVLFSIHSTYGYVWLLKDILIPDKNFRAPLAKSTGTGVFLGFFFLFGLLLTPYYSFGYYAASSGVELPPYVLAVAISFWSFGMVLMMVSDAQKYYSLQLRPGKLITTGMFTSLRSPNYLGELITYFAYVFLSAHWVPVFVILFEMAVIWVPNMIRKDKSLSRHPDFASWKARSWHMVPYVW